MFQVTGSAREVGGSGYEIPGGTLQAGTIEDVRCTAVYALMGPMDLHSSGDRIEDVYTRTAWHP